MIKQSEKLTSVRPCRLARWGPPSLVSPRSCLLSVRLRFSRHLVNMTKNNASDVRCDHTDLDVTGPWCQSEQQSEAIGINDDKIKVV